MKRLNLTEAFGLISAKSSPAISIYLGTNVQGPDSHRTLASNLQRLCQLTEAAIKQKYKGVTSKRLIDGLKQAVRGMRLQNSRGGIALFHSEGFTGLLKLPTPVKDLSVTADSFHLKPVLKANQLRRSFYLLAFKKQSADFYKVTTDKISKLETRNFANTYLTRQIRLGAPFPVLPVKKRDRLEACLEDMNRKIDLRCSIERLPLLLAGHVFHQTIFRNISSYPYLVASGMYEDISQHDEKNLSNLSSLFMEQYFAAFDDHAIRTFEQAEMTGHTTSRLEVIATAAVQGKIKHLFIAEDRHIWGQLNRVTGQVRLVAERDKAGTDDVLDDLAEVTLLKQGEVTVLPAISMPDTQPIAAIIKGTAGERPLMHELPGYLPAHLSDHSIRISA